MIMWSIFLQHALIVLVDGWSTAVSYVTKGSNISVLTVWGINSPIHKAAGLTVPGRSMISTGTIPVGQKSVHWLPMGAAGRNDLLRSFCTAAGCTAAL